MTTVEKARQFAELAHAEQRRKGAAALPYASHLDEVAALVAGFGGDEDQVMAAWLHDTVEDCGIALDALGEAFGPRVAALVAELTDDKALPKARRKELQIETAAQKSPAAGLVKIADKMSNIRGVADDPPPDWSLDRRRAYLDWAEAVVAGLQGVPEAARIAFSAEVKRARAILARDTGVTSAARVRQ